MGANEGNRFPKSALKHIIFFLCYEKGHYANECIVKLKDVKSVIENFQALTTAGRASVPSYSYNRALKIIRRNSDPAIYDKIIPQLNNMPELAHYFLGNNGTRDSSWELHREGRFHCLYVSSCPMYS